MTDRKRLIHLPMAVALGVILLLETSCALYSPSNDKKPIVKECTVPPDQSGTISGHWQVTPIPFAFHQNDFQADEVASIIAAAESWNQFYKASKGIKPLDYGTTEAPKTSAANDPTQAGALCAQGIIQGKTFSGNVLVYKMGRWPATY